MMKNFEFLKDTKNLIIFDVTCIVIVIVGQYRNFDFIEWGSFKLSFDFMFFAALVGTTVSSVILVWKTLAIFISWIKGLFLLNTLKKCTPEEKAFLYNRIYQNDNELRIDMTSDSYFYKRVVTFDAITYKLYKQKYDTKEKMIKFLRQLENKQIIRKNNSYSMIIQQQVWSMLVKHATEIFKDLKNDTENK